MKEVVSLVAEIAVIVGVIVFFASLIGVRIYKKRHHLPSGDCAACHGIDSKRLLKDYHAFYGKR